MKMTYTETEKQYLEKMHINYDKDNAVKELRKAQSLGMTVEEWREAQRKENIRKTYTAKIARYQKAIEEMQAELAKLG